MPQRAKPSQTQGEETLQDPVELSRLRSKLARAVRTSCPPWLGNSVEDIIQSAMLRVMEIAKRSEGEIEFKSSYLWKVAYSALVDEIRRLRRRREVEFMEGALHFQRPSFPDPERAAESNEIGDRVDDCLTRLLNSRRSAVTAYLHGHTVPETARLLGWTVKKAENLVYRGLAELRECLKSKGIVR